MSRCMRKNIHITYRYNYKLPNKNLHAQCIYNVLVRRTITR